MQRGLLDTDSAFGDCSADWRGLPGSALLHLLLLLILLKIGGELSMNHKDEQEQD